MATKAKQKQFSASIAVKVWVEIPIVGAEDLNSALALAKEIKLEQALEAVKSGDVYDSSCDVISITNQRAWE